ncbi:HAD family hydrolase [Jeongeupia wiesaeckerbachi]|uniref:HAD family hydrolase n=1 Tax=Jeongeupia wiesaeckerbachi TaxID=3051218 RepID=UPI003D80959B
MAPDRPRLLRAILFDWGGTLMEDDPANTTAMAEWPDVQRVPGALEALAACRSHITVCVATNATVSRDEEVWNALSRVGLADGIKHVFSRQSLGFGKQDPRFWQHVQAELDLPPQ